MKRLASEIKYAFYLTFHPFKGFWDIKYEGAGSLGTAFLILGIFTAMQIAHGLYAGYLFNPGGGVSYNVLKSIAEILLVFFAWCLSNWCLTCLFDGEGSFRDILRATAYALQPMILVWVLLIPLSHMLSQREAAIYTFVYTLGILWTAFLLFSSTLVTHQYTMFKTVLMILCIILGMCVLAYIALLFFNLIGQMTGFVEVLVKEIQNRS